MFRRYFDGANDQGAQVDAGAVAEFIAAQQAADAGGLGDIADVQDPNNVVDPDADVDSTNSDQDTIPGKLGEDPDLSDLDPELRVIAEQRLKDWRADYTRKGQELAEMRKLADQYAGGDVNAMQQALEFTHRLQTDPEFREALYQELHGQVGTQTPQADVQADPNDLFDDDDIPSGVKSQLTQLQDRLAAFEQRDKEAQKEAHRQHLLQQATADLDSQMSDIRSANPDIKDEHVDQIYLFGHATGGDLIAAEQLWRNVRNEAQAELIANKNAIPSTLGAGRPSSHAGAPSEPITTFEEAGKAAVEFLNANRQG